MSRFKLLTILLLSLSVSIYSQSENRLFEVNQTKVDSYLDSICRLYVKNLNTNKQLDLSTPIKSARGGTHHIFGDSVKLRSAPTDSSGFKKLLGFQDIVFIPRYEGRLQYYPLTFNIRPGRYDHYLFCITEQGQYGFINSNEYTHSNNYIKKLPNIDFLLIERPKIAIIKNDYSEFRIFEVSKIDYSEKFKSLVYSIEDYRSEKLGKIFTFNIESWTENYIGQGYSPIFIEDDIIYWTKKDEKIHRYNLGTLIDSTIFSVPDSLTMWLCGPDFCYPGKIRTKKIRGEDLIHLFFCSKIIKPGEDECGTEANFLITKKGEIREIE